MASPEISGIAKKLAEELPPHISLVRPEDEELGLLEQELEKSGISVTAKQIVHDGNYEEVPYADLNQHGDSYIFLPFEFIRSQKPAYGTIHEHRDLCSLTTQALIPLFEKGLKGVFLYNVDLGPETSGKIAGFYHAVFENSKLQIREPFVIDTKVTHTYHVLGRTQG